MAFTPCLGWRPDALAARKLSARRCEWARGLLARLVRPPCLSKRSREEDESHVRSCGILFPVERWVGPEIGEGCCQRPLKPNATSERVGRREPGFGGSFGSRGPIGWSRRRQDWAFWRAAISIATSTVNQCPLHDRPDFQEASVLSTWQRSDFNLCGSPGLRASFD